MTNHDDSQKRDNALQGIDDRFHKILEGMQVQLMITEPETGEIIFVNDEMLRGYGLPCGMDLRGQKCYTVFQGKSERCEFCRIDDLLRNPEIKIEWLHYNEPTDSYYKKWDSLIEWSGGRIAHLQQSVNVTDSHRREEALEIGLKQQRIINEITQDFISIDNLDQSIPRAIALVSQQLELDRALLARIDRESNSCVGVYCWEANGDYNPEADKKVNLTVEYVEEAFVKEELTYFTAKNFSLSETFVTTAGRLVADFAAAPVFVSDELWGFIIMESYEKECTYNPDMIFMTEVLAYLISGVQQRAYAQRRVREAEARVQTMLDTAPLSCLFIEEDGTPVYCNEETLKTYRVSSSEEVLFRFFDLMPETQPNGKNSREEAHAMIQKALQSGYEAFEWVHSDAYGKLIPAEITLFKVNWRGKPSLTAYMRDLTKEKAQLAEIENTHKALVFEKERAEESAKAKATFLANMSHEIRTPMNAIIAMGHVLSVAEQDPIKQSYIQNVLRASEILLSTINDILDFSKIDANKIEVVNDEYNLYDMLCGIVDINAIKITAKNLTLLTEVAPDLPRRFYGDEGKIRQIITNFLSNAVNYTREGSIELRLSSEYISDDTCRIRIDVADTGIGIREEDLGKLFTAFAQTDLKLNRGIQGTGLGLAICDGLSNALGGKIEVESTYGAGSTFSFIIEQKVIDPTPIVTIDDAPSKRALIVGQGTAAHNVTDKLRRMGVTSELANDLDEAIILMNQNTYTHIFYWYQFSKDIGSRLGGKLKTICPTIIKNFSDLSDDYMRKRVNMVFLPVMVTDLAQIINTGRIGSHSIASKLGKASTLKTENVHALIVDDNDINLIAASEILKQYDIVSDVASSGKQAITMAAEHEYDIIFMDQMMPEMDGVEATRQIRNTSEYNRALPIVALSANAMAGVRETLIANGMTDFLAKPIMVAELEQILTTYLPKEKLIDYGGRGASASTHDYYSDLIDALEESQLLKVRSVLARIEIPVSAYLKIISSLNNSLPTYVEKLRTFFDQRDMEQFRIEVHSQKGSLANAGADRLSEYARELETAATVGDVAYIKTHLDIYCEALDMLCDDLSLILFDYSDEPLFFQEGSERELSSISDELFYMKELLAELEHDGFMDTLKPLLQYDYGDESNQKLRQIYTAADIFDIVRANELIDALITIINESKASEEK